jgi:putative mRNA 3-end processing factor
LELRFLGACREVGKSCIAVETDDLRIALDCGIKVHDHNEPPALEHFEFDACILTHSHLDHSGSLPVLYKHRYIPTFCTFPTVPITTLLLEDSEKIAQLKGHQLPYKRSDVSKLYRKFTPIPYRTSYEFFDSSKFEFYDAGHIPGSAGVLFESKTNGKKKRVFYTGDFNYSDTKLLGKAKLPEGKVDALVIESTYAFREHPARKELERKFCESVRECLEDDCIALVPAFAVGRSQELLLVLHSLLQGKNKVFLDGMGKKVSELLHDYPSYVANYDSFADCLSKTFFVENSAGRRRACEKPGVIVTTSGMLDGGPVLNYLRVLEQSGKGKVFLTGFQVAGTNGRALMEGKDLFIDGKKQRITLPVESFDFSAHSGAKELREAIKKIDPGKIYCVHGDDCEGFAKELREKEGFDAVAPVVGNEFTV